MSYTEDELRLKKILTTIINSAAGLKYALLTDDTGITILSQAKFKFSNHQGISVEKIGAIGGAVFVAGEEQGLILGYGSINLQITEYLEGMIFSMKVGKGVLCIVSDNNAQIGFIRATMKKWGPMLTSILDRYLKADQAEMSKEVKELFKSDTFGML